MALHVMPGQYEYEPGYVMTEPLYGRKTIDNVRDFEMHEGDVTVVTYPKAGKGVTFTVHAIGIA